MLYLCPCWNNMCAILGFNSLPKDTRNNIYILTFGSELKEEKIPITVYRYV